jgi:hypothetical protein
MMIEPITPAQAAERSMDFIPEFVYAAVNQLISENYSPGRRFNIKVKDIKELIFKTTNMSTADFNTKWLDFEPFYRKAGWSVSYDGPGYNESYDAFYEFKENK